MLAGLLGQGVGYDIAHFIQDASIEVQSTQSTDYQQFGHWLCTWVCHCQPIIILNFSP